MSDPAQKSRCHFFITEDLIPLRELQMSSDNHAALFAGTRTQQSIRILIKRLQKMQKLLAPCFFIFGFIFEGKTYSLPNIDIWLGGKRILGRVR